jgi:hypothetical protein
MSVQELARVQGASEHACWGNKEAVLARGSSAKWVHVMGAKTVFESVRRIEPSVFELVLTR